MCMRAYKGYYYMHSHDAIPVTFRGIKKVSIILTENILGPVTYN